MPIRDHHRPPVSGRVPWPTLHSVWLSAIGDRLNGLLPPGYVALESVHVAGRHEIDIATLDGRPLTPPDRNGAVATEAAVYTPPAAVGSFVAPPTDVYELLVHDRDISGQVVGAIELVSPSNKDRPESRRAFAAKCASYLVASASVVVLDVVTTRTADLHAEVLAVMDAPAELATATAGARLYAAAYRPVLRGDRTEVDVWATGFDIGDVLPTMPLRLVRDLFVPVEFELTYTDACRRRRLAD